MIELLETYNIILDKDQVANSIGNTICASANRLRRISELRLGDLAFVSQKYYDTLKELYPEGKISVVLFEVDDSIPENVIYVGHQSNRSKLIKLDCVIGKELVAVNGTLWNG